MDSGGMSCCCTSLVEGISDSGVRSHCAGLLKAGKQACRSGDLPLRGAAGMGKDKHTGAAALLDVEMFPRCVGLLKNKWREACIISGELVMLLAWLLG